MAKRNSKGQFVSAKTAKKTAVKAPSKSNAVMLSINTSFPTNCQRVDSTLSNELRGKGMASHKGLQYIMVKRQIASKGKFAGQQIIAPWEVFSNVVNIKNRINQLVERRSLDMSIKGNRLLPVSQLDIFKSELNDLNRELQDAKEELKIQLPAMKAEDLDRLKNSTDKDGNPVDLTSYYDDTKYPTEAKIDTYGIKKILARIDSDLIPEDVDDIFRDAEKEKTQRLISKVTDMFVAINGYIQADSKKFTENSIENVVEEAELLKEFDLGNDNEAFNKLCDKAVEIANNINASAIRQARNNVDKSGKEEVVKDAKEFLEKTQDDLSKAFDNLKSDCEGLF
jgi:hypothetical protein